MTVDYEENLIEVIADKAGEVRAAVAALKERHGKAGVDAAWLYWKHVADGEAGFLETIRWCTERFLARVRFAGDFFEAKYCHRVNAIAHDLADHVDWSAFSDRLEDDGKIETLDDHNTDLVYVFDTSDKGNVAA